MSDCCSAHPADPEPDHCNQQSSGRRDWVLYGSLALIAPALILSFFLDDHTGIISEFSHAVREFAGMMWWGLGLGILAVGALRFVPQSRVRKWLGERSNFNGLFRAVSAGLLFDLCSHGILLVGLQLYRRGLSLGQTMAFLIASPWNSFSLTLILFGLIGWKWTLLFIACSAVIAFISGWIFHLLETRSIVPPNPYRLSIEESEETEPRFSEQIRPFLATPQGWGKFLSGAVKESRMIIRWILFGIVLASILRVALNPDMFADWFGPTIAGLGLTLLAATIIEVCSEGSSPIAADLLNRAAAPGNGFTFLMAGVATDYTEILALRETTRSWKIALLLPLVTVPQILLIGWILNTFT